MFTIAGIRQLHRWTHSSLGLVLDHLASLPAGDYTREVAGFGFPTLRAQVVHILNCEGFWVHTLQQSPFTDEDQAKRPAVSDARELESKVCANTLAYLSGLTDEQLNTETELHFPDGDITTRTPALILHHMLTHAFHHKGQIVAMCRILGHPAPDTDLNRFH
ncbi:MAG TPA: DinB family protein [Terracidiphilus sp.]|nr:DinB family protein [Terracidiphilus sp.]